MIFRKTATTHSCFTLKVSNKNKKIKKVIHHNIIIIMILVTTKMSEKSLKTVAMVTKILPLIPKLKIIYP